MSLDKIKKHSSDRQFLHGDVTISSLVLFGCCLTEEHTCGILMTSHEWTGSEHRFSTPERDRMREYRRPTLCVIDENGYDVTKTLHNDSSGGSLSNLSDSNCGILAGSDCGVSITESPDHNANFTKPETKSCLWNNTCVKTSNDKDLDLSELKATTTRLKLTTRRPSTVAWKQEHFNSSCDPVLPKFDPSTLQTAVDDTFTEERKNRINEALAWLRNELQRMRNEDEVLARQLLSIRHDIHQLKLQRSCEEHQEMLEDVTMDMEEKHALNEISDILITDSVQDSPLKHLGVTRMHLSARRFSTC
ncbi:protein FAM167A-like isoform X2 [Mya arenaria]|uniref:protein FAM167A-like isoform X2 n=1 Tax=Mya arenaria TaxID=6604 RepID=UPI0022E168D6|nr:protein FAM167A-like isoform X2 [Mya arenaria]